MSGQLHAPATLPWYQYKEILGGRQRRSSGPAAQRWKTFCLQLLSSQNRVPALRNNLFFPAVTWFVLIIGLVLY